jgi:demethylmenaquinone methyltransferase/2-methoxy-6-polyprenyl-1,4-benzoquinol methylase
MKGLRRSYYNLFSRVYDAFIRLHSGAAEGLLRRFIAERAQLREGDRALDLCTGTGSVALELAQTVGEGGIAIGLDFSHGMLRRAREKSTRLHPCNLYLVEADASMLPFKDSCFKAVTCSHALYELKGSGRESAIEEVARVTSKGGRFCLMEHAEPEGRVDKLFFFARMCFLGSGDARTFFQNESQALGAQFGQITTEMAPTGKSKLMCGERRGVG